MEMKIYKNEARKRYETLFHDKIAFIEYIEAKNAVYLTHTEVPASLEGRGIGSKLIKNVLDILMEKDAKLAPLCPFVAAFIRKNPVYKSLLASGYHV
ncbi:GNAT family N-acetyltransferase [Gangjinia marincola]|uniref:GNAT family N-acetyltransferase n=1 Tax=Gangjinia marincola TaxID=578463 RepID=A0ABP3XZA1_9FLAO